MGVGSIGETGNEIKVVSNEKIESTIDEESDVRRSQGVSRMSPTTHKSFKVDGSKANKQYLNADL